MKLFVFYFAGYYQRKKTPELWNAAAENPELLSYRNFDHFESLCVIL